MREFTVIGNVTNIVITIKSKLHTQCHNFQPKYRELTTIYLLHCYIFHTLKNINLYRISRQWIIYLNYYLVIFIYY